MNILKFLLSLIAIFKKSAEQQIKEMPEPQKSMAIGISTVIQVIKKGYEAGLPAKDIAGQLVELSGFNRHQLANMLIAYLESRGNTADSLEECINKIISDITKYSNDGVKTFWKGVSDTLMMLYANIDLKALAYGVGELIWETFVKGKVKI